ncbi:hypothetical protein T4B_3590 [Trichinella pseudospiralis]|uniref:Uncharacterized protein n=2 Tax=Trichinella pseudospiralis TaxID=6337 RepID=A0A0V1FPY9_TRIPS|nr:hypothetical protein T4A_1952 [Trichinella pseudospiralis]KRY88087.1 hypothetical protein T4D_8600 [Trichinella pseudospiralis]KRZ33114.1 hypothetical protein T4B_3590 [Trichinella pseudospiralis]KRZ39634.1 hypothetical protein T4C_13280 [Trichinella pseudospiralis]
MQNEQLFPNCEEKLPFAVCGRFTLITNQPCILAKVFYILSNSTSYLESTSFLQRRFDLAKILSKDFLIKK